MPLRLFFVPAYHAATPNDSTTKTMLNNDILRSVRFILDLRDNQLPKLIQQGGLDPADLDIPALLKRDDDEGFKPCNDRVLSAFLDGVITLKRGAREPAAGAAPAAPQRMSNNLILKKLRIAFELKQEDIQELILRAGLTVSSAELGALFRKPDHKHYRECGDQFLRNLLRGLTLKLRPDAKDTA